MKKERNKKISSTIYTIMQIVAIIVSITGISVASIYNIQKASKESKNYIDKKISEICDEIRILDLQLQHYTLQKEYMIIDGVGNKADPATLLNYRPLITKMEEIHKDYYFFDLIMYMNFCGYDVKGREIRLSTEWFFGMQYEQQAEILSQMFVELEPHTYRLAKEYQYYADVIDYGDHIEYTNVRAEATDIEERTIYKFLCMQDLNDEPLGLIKITNENSSMIYPKIDY